jgi:hypothetical protein
MRNLQSILCFRSIAKPEVRRQRASPNLDERSANRAPSETTFTMTRRIGARLARFSEDGCFLGWLE